MLAIDRLVQSSLLLAALSVGCAPNPNFVAASPDLAEPSPPPGADLGSEADLARADLAGSPPAGSDDLGGALGGGGADLGKPAGLDNGVHPGGNFDLTGWQLQLPTGTTDMPDIIDGAQLAGPDGLSNLYFYTDSDGAMTFMDPTTGVTTMGSKHPRSELREVTAGWTTAGMNSETVTVAVPKVPDHVTIGQIFQSAPAPSKPLAELQYVAGGKLQLLLESDNEGGTSKTSPVGSVSDGAKFTYALSLTGTTITVLVGTTKTTFTLPPTFVGESFYFKVGDYDQTATIGTPGTTPGTIVKVYALVIVHE